MRPKIEISHVYKHFTVKKGVVHALEDITLDIHDGEFVCLVGPSGCGKSTLLNLIAGLDFPEKGAILLDDVLVTGPGNDRVVMFQESALFPWLDVMHNVLYGLKLKPELNLHQRKEIAASFLKLVGLTGFEHAHVHQLSGGMKQRVALARALAPNPHVLLMDEPFAALDAMTREQLYIDIQNIQQREKKTILLVTHSIQESVCLGDRVILLTPNPGRVKEELLIDLPRPREVNSQEVAEKTWKLTRDLKK